jgi:hypothetical protein
VKGSPWSRLEVEATVAAYLDMLILELAGQPYTKAERRRQLQALLEGRSEAAIELKHQNISAVLIELGVPYIDGYKPRFNYQGLLAEVVDDRLEGMPDLQLAVRSAVEQEVDPPGVDDILSAWRDPPDPLERNQYGKERRVPRPRMIDYLKLEAQNSALGLAGERFVIDFERARLIRARQQRLADRVEHVATTRGDGDGFDILSYEENGRDRLIEVKTTKFGQHTPFYVTRNEVEVSRAKHERYHLYRVFDFRSKPRVFGVSGALDQVCLLDPVQWVGRVG